MKDWRQVDYEARRAKHRADVLEPYLAARGLPGTPKTVIAADWTTAARAPHVARPAPPDARPSRPSWWRRLSAWLARGF